MQRAFVGLAPTPRNLTPEAAFPAGGPSGMEVGTSVGIAMEVKGLSH
jgi:hypothetical protein